jgi:hypothetical protein
MRDAIPTRLETRLSSLMPRLLGGLLLCGLLLPAAAAPAGACGLDWADPAVVWPNGSTTPHTFPLTGGGCPAGAMVTITVTPTPASGSFLLGTPAEDCASGCLTNLFGLSHDLGLDFDPSGPGMSPITITAVFSTPLTNVVLEVSDIDFGGQVPPDPAGSRLDQVMITSNAVTPPTLSYKTAGLPSAHTFDISGNTATARCTAADCTTAAVFPSCNIACNTTDQNFDNGTVIANFGLQSVTTVTITYNEAGSGTNPAGRGIGVLANLTATPVELTGFTIE